MHYKGSFINLFFCLDDYYDSDRKAYYSSLQEIDQKTLDLTGWLEYFTKGVRLSIDAVKERVIRLSSERLRKTKRGQIALTERQMRIIEFINQNGRIRNKDIREMFSVSNRAAVDMVSKLIDMKVLKRFGKGRNTHYRIL